MRCPRDRNLLVQYKDEGTLLWRCDVCSGAFISSLPSDDSRHMHRTKIRPEWDPEIQCPADSTKMQGFHYQDVIVDMCEKCHGVWLDSDEIPIVLGHPLPDDSFDIVVNSMFMVLK